MYAMKFDGQPPQLDEIERLRAALAERQRQIDAVHRISQALCTKTRLGDLLRETLQVSLDTVGANAGSIYRYYPEKQKLVFDYVIGEAAPLLTGREIDPNTGIVGEVFQTGVPGSWTR